MNRIFAVVGGAGALGGALVVAAGAQRSPEADAAAASPSVIGTWGTSGLVCNMTQYWGPSISLVLTLSTLLVLVAWVSLEARSAKFGTVWCLPL